MVYSRPWANYHLIIVWHFVLLVNLWKRIRVVYIAHYLISKALDVLLVYCVMVEWLNRIMASLCLCAAGIGTCGCVWSACQNLWLCFWFQCLWFSIKDQGCQSCFANGFPLLCLSLPLADDSSWKLRVGLSMNLPFPEVIMLPLVYSFFSYLCTICTHYLSPGWDNWSAIWEKHESSYRWQIHLSCTQKKLN